MYSETSRIESAMSKKIVFEVTLCEMILKLEYLHVIPDKDPYRVEHVGSLKEHFEMSQFISSFCFWITRVNFEIQI